MSSALGDGYGDEEARELFYPSQRKTPTDYPTIRRRRPNLLPSLDDKSYREIYQYICDRSGQLCFPSLDRITRLTKEDGRVLSAVMGHVITWANVEPRVITNSRINNKPQLREDLGCVLRPLADDIVHRWREKTGTTLDSMGMDGWPAVDIASALLQQEVLDLALENMAWFRSARGKASLEPTPAASTAAYARRFSQQGPWAAVLQAARRFLGDDLQPRWVAAPTTDEEEEPEVLAGLTAATLASSVCDFLATLPSLSEEAVVCRKMGSKAVRSALALWFSQHKQPSAREYSSTDPRPPSAREYSTDPRPLPSARERSCPDPSPPSPSLFVPSQRNAPSRDDTASKPAVPEKRRTRTPSSRKTTKASLPSWALGPKASQV